MEHQVSLEAMGGRGSGKTRILNICNRVLMHSGYHTLDQSMTRHRLLVTWKSADPFPEPSKGFLMECVNCGAELSIVLSEDTDTTHFGKTCPVCGCATLTRRGGDKT